MARSVLYKDVLPFTAMILLECVNVGLNVLFKAATMKGLSYYVFVVYSSGVATVVLLPFAIFCRTPGLPLSLSLWCRIGIVGILRSLVEIIAFAGINYSSPTLASALGNLVPAFTFILAIIFRMERLDLRSSSSRAKVMGTMIAISGAFVVTLWKGSSLIRTPSLFNSLEGSLSSQSNWIIGSIFISSGYLLLSICYIIQAQISKEFTADLVLVFLYNFCTTAICAPTFLFMETNYDAWRVRPDVSLAAIVYAGLFGYIFDLLVAMWCLRLKGPVYVALFNPLSVAIAAVMGVIFLRDTVHLGTVIGAVVISFGFYAVMWGRAEEEKREDLVASSVEALSTETMPLLQGHITEKM